MKQKMILFLVAIFVSGCVAESTPPGLTVKDGLFYKDGKPFYQACAAPTRNSALA